MEQQEINQWASAEFGSARFGHAAKTACLVRVGRLMASRPAPRVTAICDKSADRQAVYGFFENDGVAPEEITAAAGRAALQRGSQKSEYLLVAVDGTSLRVTDRSGTKGFGQVGKHTKSKGMQVQTALVLDPMGTALGVLAQRYWARPEAKKKKTRSKTDRRQIKQKETQQWLDVLADCGQRTAEVRPERRLWYQMDRGYDCWPILHQMEESAAWYTVRSAYNRALWTEPISKEGEDDRYVQDALGRSKSIGTLSLEVSASRSDKGPNCAAFVAVSSSHNSTN